MNVNCDACKKVMACIEKTQNDVAITRSVFVCDGCAARVVVTRQGIRKEDISEDRHVSAES